MSGEWECDGGPVKGSANGTGDGGAVKGSRRGSKVYVGV